MSSLGRGYLAQLVVAGGFSFFFLRSDLMAKFPNGSVEDM